MIKTPSGAVLRDGQAIKLEPQVLNFLLLLIQNKEHILTREEIVSEVWSGKNASDDAIRALVKKLRIALGDNARAPKFVKTIPLQGYLFIMPVELNFSESVWWRKKQVIYTLSALLIVLITLVIQAQFGSVKTMSDTPLQAASISKLMSIKGSDVSLYLSKNDKLLYSSRSSNDQASQLYVKDLNSNASTRLTWGSADFTKGIFSPDGSQAAVNKQDDEQVSLLLFNFDPSLNSTNFEALTLDMGIEGSRLNALSFSTNSENLYLFTDTLTSAEAYLGPALIRYNIKSKNSVLLDFPLSANSSVVEAIESDNGKFLAVLVHADKSAQIYVQDLETEEIILSKTILDLPTSMVWSADARSITFATLQGELMNLKVRDQRIYKWTGLTFKVNKVVSQCGENCFVLKEQEDSLLKLVELPVSVNEQVYLSALQFEQASTQRFPTYFNQGQGIFFLAVSDDNLMINRYTEDSGLTAVYDLPKTSNINTFVLSPNENMFAGELDGRIFLYKLDLGTFSFLTSRDTESTNPVWSLSGDELFYRQVVNGKPVIYAQDIVSKQVRRKAEGLIFILPLDSSHWLLVDENYQAFLYQTELQNKVQVAETKEQSTRESIGLVDTTLFSEEILSTSLKFAELDSVNSNGFDIQNNALFFIKNSAGSSFLNKFDIEKKIIEKSELAVGGILYQFDIHPDMQKLLTVQSSLSQSNLLKAEDLILESRQLNQVITETP